MSAIVLTGASSSGKSTWRKRFSVLAPRPMAFLSGDAMDLPPDVLSKQYLKGIPEADAEVWQESVYRSFYRTLAVWGDAGVGVIGEALFKSERVVDICRQELAGRQFVIVRLVWDEAVRVQRELRRGDRPRGTTLGIWEWAQVDLEIDTAATPPVDAARQVVALVFQPAQVRHAQQ